MYALRFSVRGLLKPDAPINYLILELDYAKTVPCGPYMVRKQTEASSGSPRLGSRSFRKATALRRAGCRRMFEEAGSGGRCDRPVLHDMLRQLREGDVVLVWKLDRLSRSLKDLLHIMEKIEAAGAGFRSLTESIDTTTPAGRMMMQMVGSFAEFERAMIRERTSVGLAQARAEGRERGAWAAGAAS
jgi:hypothetical protein